MPTQFQQAPAIRYFFYLLLIVSLFIWSCLNQKGAPGDTNLKPIVILISFDGFRWDYLEKTKTPNLVFLAKTGVRAKGLISVFPTKTFPNHYSMVTGLYPENHGIIANNMYDPVFDAKFSLRDREALTDSRWWAGEPIWVTAAKQGLLSATYFWPGSEAKIKGKQPTYWYPYKHETPEDERVDQILAWLDLPLENRPSFIAGYFSNLDDAGHVGGPDSPEVIEAIQTIDSVLGRLLRGLEKRQILDDVNIILVSDHGMTPTSPERVIFIDEFIDLSKAEVIDWSPVLALWPKAGTVEAIYNALVHAHPNLTVYRKEEIPERFHYKNNRCIPPILGVADVGWCITSRDYFSSHSHYFKGGDHGYDNQLLSMRGIFIARGPAFKSGLVVEPFQNIHIYNLMAAILDLQPAPNDGSLDSVRVMLR